MAARFGFPRRMRLTRATQFRAVRQGGKHLRVFPLRIRALARQGAEPNRLGLAVGRKVGGAVLRNRWKRAVREAFRLHAHRLPTTQQGAPVSWDLMVSIDWSAGPGDVGRVQHAVRSAFDTLAQSGPAQGDGA